MPPAIQVEHLGKRYRLGQTHAGSIREVVNRTVGRIFGRKDHRLPQPETGPANGSLPQKDGDEFWALKDVSFNIQPGEVVGVIGKNGAGKSTLLKILSGITAPTTGRVMLHGRVASLLEVGTGFHPELTGRENVYLNGAILGMTKAEVRRKFDEIVAFAEIEQFIDTPVKRYSSGMYVRLAFAVAAHLEPEILIVDEVLAVGDVAFQRKCLGKMGDVAQHGRTVLFVSHNMQAIRTLCRDAIWLHDGMLKQKGESGLVVEYYLQATARSLQDESLEKRIARLPHDPDFRLHGVTILQDGLPTTSVVSGKSVEIVVDYSIFSRSPGFHLWLLLYDAEGTLIFDSLHNGDEEELPIVEPGRYQSVAVLPENLLAARAYELGLSAGIANIRGCIPDPLRISLDVQHAGLVNRAYPGYSAPGKLAPLIEWTNRRMPVDHAVAKAELAASH